MNKILITLILAILYLGKINAQCEYTEAQYEVSSKLNIVYGEAIGHDQVPVTLRMNIYKPIGDDNLKRPLMVWIHGGGWFAGKKEEMIEHCKALAKRGFVAATISYRLGFERARPLAYPFIHDKHEMIRAVYRGMQDARGAIRFLKNRASQDSIDIQNVFVGGASAGAFIALSVTYMDQGFEKPISANMQSTIKRNDGDVTRPDLGSIYGDLNLGGESSDVKGVINTFGGLVKTNIVSNNKDKFAFHYHQTADPIVPCEVDKPYWSLPFVKDNYPIVNGSCNILNDYKSFGFPEGNYASMIHEGGEHGIHDNEIYTNEIVKFLQTSICGDPTATSDIETSSIMVYPNPASNFALIPMVNDLSVIGLDGQYHFIQTTNKATKLQLDISSLPSGIYMITGRDESGIIKSWRLCVEQIAQ